MTNTVYDIANARSCQDCVIIMTNGDNSGMTEEEFATWEANRAAISPSLEGWEWSGVQCDSWAEDGAPCDCDGEDHIMDGWFSWSPCEWCGDTHGGTRFNVAIMKRLS